MPAACLFRPCCLALLSKLRRRKRRRGDEDVLLIADILLIKAFLRQTLHGLFLGRTRRPTTGNTSSPLSMTGKTDLYDMR